MRPDRARLDRLRVDRLRLVKVGRGALAARAAALCSDEWLAGARVMKEDGAAWVRLASVDGAPVVVKCRALGSVRKRAQSLLGAGHAHRQWRGALRLASAGIRTGAPLFIARARAGRASVELLGLEYVEGQTLLEVLDTIARGRGARVREQHEMARAVGRSVAELLLAGLVNRDHKASNLVVMMTERGAEAGVIDCVSIARRGASWTSDGGGSRMLAALMIEAIGCGCTPRRALWMRALREAIGVSAGGRDEESANVRGVVRSVQELIAAHGDPRPRVNPLARSIADG